MRFIFGIREFVDDMLTKRKIKKCIRAIKAEKKK